MELTKEQIKRIDSFLEGIGVEYIDIRFEMIDHIASEIEDKVENKKAFFQRNGFQTPFIKYMLSRKKELFFRYKKQVKKLNSYYIKNIVKDFIKLLFLPKNIFLLGLISFFCLFFGSTYLRETSILVFGLLVVNYLHLLYLNYSFNKKFKQIKIVTVYSSISSMLIILPINFPNFINVFYDGNYNKLALYSYLISFIFSYLLNQSFLSKKRLIDNKYQYLQ